MKKLMIAAAIVCAAAFAQAASVNWTSGSIKMAPSANLSAGLVDGQTYEASGAKITANGWKTYGAVAADYIITFYWGEGAGAKTDTVKGSLGADDFSSGTIASTISSVVFDEAAGTAYTYDIQLTASGTDGAGNAFTLTSTQTGLEGSIQLGDVKFTSAAPTAWTASVVPEPTSGLLLLLGVAGLALRRRRA